MGAKLIVEVGARQRATGPGTSMPLGEDEDQQSCFLIKRRSCETLRSCDCGKMDSLPYQSNIGTPAGL